MGTRGIHSGLILWLAVAGIVLPGWSQDWPTYQHDATRSGVTAAPAPVAPELQWTFQPPSPPEKAWGDPKPAPVEGILELPRMRFDDAFHVAAGGGLVVFGSSSDHKVYALDAATGAVRWEFFTGGPVRLAPTLAGDHVYVGSDDGYAYCLKAADGSLAWCCRAGPTDERVLGNGQMISLWPVRTGVLVADGTAYFGAGVFPAEGLFLYALDALTGTVLWRNDTYGSGGSSDVSPQGYMLLGKDQIIVPSGRRTPIAFSREDGRVLVGAFQAARFAVGPAGGTFAVLDGDTLYNGTEQMFGFRAANGALASMDYARRLVLASERVALQTGTELVVCPKDTWLETARQRAPLHQHITQTAPALAELESQRRRLDKANQPVPEALRADIERSRAAVADARANRDRLAAQERQAPAWAVPWEGADSLIMTADGVIAGGNGRVAAFAAADGKLLWDVKVPGTARGLALSEGRLLVSTDRGAICAFGAKAGESRRTALAAAPLPTPDPVQVALVSAVTACAPKRGFALVLGSEAMPAAIQLGQVPGLRTVLATVTDAQLAPLRHELNRLGLYGHRVAVTGVSAAALPFSDYFANLVVWASSTPPEPAVCQELVRVLKPWGGILVVPAAAVDRFPTAAEALTRQPGVTGEWAALVRGALSGAGTWTHEYAEAGNTACSDDRRVGGDIGVLWYGEPGPERIPSRHASAAAPLGAGGRMFVQGENVLMAYDSSNGVELWTRELAGATRLGLKTGCSNLVYGRDSLFVVAGGVCHRLRADTGETLHTYTLPAAPDGKDVPWGPYLAVVGELLLGSDPSQGLFALKVDSGDIVWTHRGQALDWITVAVSDGRVVGVDRRATDEQKAGVLTSVDPAQRLDRLGKPIPPDIRVVFCLELATGRLLWESPQYISDCIRVGQPGGELTLMAARGVVILCGQPWNGHFWQEFYAGDFSRRSLIALAAADGRTLWSGRKGYRSRPLIVGDMVVAEPWAHDLRTGTVRRRLNPLTSTESEWQFSRPGHHCGNISACTNGLFFRSGCAAYYDLKGDFGTVHFGGQRPGCWINCIPANGVVMMPEASSGCICPYSLHCTTVFSQRRVPRAWGTYSAAGSLLPLRHLALNLGAPGDRRDEEGQLWLAYPRPGSGRLVLPLKLQEEFAPTGGFSRSLPAPPDAGALPEWLHGCGARRLSRLRVPVLGEADGTALYSVRLYLRSGPDAVAGACPLTISLQGRKVAEGLDLVTLAGGPGRVVVREFADVRATDVLDLALAGPTSPAGSNAPGWALTALELACDKVLHVGMSASPAMVNDAVPEGHIEVVNANRTGTLFEGTLRVAVPAPFVAEPMEVPLELPAEETRTTRVAIRVAQPGPVATGEARLTLARRDGTTEVERTVKVEYLANRGRLTVVPVADAYVIANASARNFGPAPMLAVDGGSQAMHDSAHALAFLRFPVQTPGRPLSVTLRLYVPEGGHPQSSDSGTICLVDGAWEESKLTYATMPKTGAQVGDLGKVDQAAWAERPLDVDLTGRSHLDLAIVPRSCDGATYDSREAPHKPELVIEYEALPPKP